MRWKKPMKLAPWIYHFNGAIIRLDSKFPHNRIWLNYYMKTPFCTPEAIGNLFTDMANRIDEANQEIVRLSNWIKGIIPIISSRQKIYFTDLNAWAEILIRELQMNKSPNLTNKRIAMININDSKIYDELQQKLTDAGFVLNVDFINLTSSIQVKQIEYDTQKIVNEM